MLSRVEWLTLLIPALVVEGKGQPSFLTSSVLETGKKIPNFLYPGILGYEKLLGPIYFMLNNQTKIFTPSVSIILPH